MVNDLTDDPDATLAALERGPDGLVALPIEPAREPAVDHKAMTLAALARFEGPMIRAAARAAKQRDYEKSAAV